MSTNGVKTAEDADMSECDGEKVVTMVDVLQEQQDIEEDANAVLGASDDKNCTYSKGYIKRQAIYACLTCCVEAKNDPKMRAGVCLACSLNCHENHELVELYTKRNFRCDCGNPKFNLHPCQYTPNKTDLNEDNSYNQNFSGLYCTCHRPYPDPESPVEDEMIQCIICEDWLHASHIEASIPTNDLYSEMICKACMDHNEFLHDYSNFAVNIETLDVDILTVNSTDTIILDKITSNGDLENERFNGTVVALSESSKIIEINNGMDVDITEEKLDEIENMKQLDAVDSHNESVKNNEVATTKEEKQEMVQTKVINQELLIDGDNNENALENIDAKELDNTGIPSNSQENNLKESTNQTIGTEALEKTITEYSPTEISNTDEKEPTFTETHINDIIMESEASQNITNCINDNVVHATEDGTLLHKTKHSETTEEILEENVDLVNKVSSKPDEEKTIAEPTEKNENNLQVKANTVNMDEKINSQGHTGQQKDGIEDTQADETEQSIEGTNCLTTDDDQTKNTGLSDTNTFETDKLLEENSENPKAEPSPEIETKEIYSTGETVVPQENILKADKLGAENIDEPDKSETTSDTLEEPNYDVKQVDSRQDTMDTTQESKLVNDVKENVDTENKNNDSNHIEMNVNSEENTLKDDDFSDKIEVAELDDISNKTESSDNESRVTNKIDLLNDMETQSDIKTNASMSEMVPKNDNNYVCNDSESKNKSTIIANNIEVNVYSTNITEPTNIENKVPSESVTSQEENINENKRKLSTEDAEDVFAKKSKLEETKKCVRPQGVRKVFKGATFWPSNFRQKLCTCNRCISMYKDLAVLYLIDLEDTVFAYETLGKQKINGGPASQYEKGLQALSSLDRIQQINALTEYNKMRDKLLDFLKSFKDRKEIVKEEDIKAFFAGMKPKREPDGVYFCR